MKNVHQTHQTLILLITMPSVLWHCWLGGRKGIQRVKNWAVGCWHSYLSGARCRLAYGPADSTATHCLLLQSNPDWFVLPFWYRLTRVVPDRGALNWCVCVCVPCLGSYAWTLQDITTQAKYHRRTKESLANNMGWSATELHQQSHTELCKKTSSGWQVILCDPIWHVSSRSGEASCKLLYSVYLTLPWGGHVLK